MHKKGIKDLIDTIEFTGFSINLGFIRLNFAGGFSKTNITIFLYNNIIGEILL